jgi:hypothetical protein
MVGSVNLECGNDTFECCGVVGISKLSEQHLSAVPTKWSSFSEITMDDVYRDLGHQPQKDISCG